MVLKYYRIVQPEDFQEWNRVKDIHCTMDCTIVITEIYIPKLIDEEDFNYNEEEED